MDGTRSDQGSDVEAAPDALAQADRDRARFRSIFDANVGYVAASLGRLGVVPGDRDDLISEIFVRVHRELGAYDPARPLRPWLFAFAARVASEHRRLARHRREVLGEIGDVPATTAAPDEALEHDDAKRLVNAGLEALDLDKRAVFVLHDLDETPVPEIARVLGIAEGTAYSRLRAARAEFTAAVRRARLGSRS
jgi:RNA polymerase sigma-70 factor (ECF subfamily)